MDLSKISVGVKTFLRDEKLFNTIQAIRDTLPEVKMIIADCGEMTEEKDGIYADLERQGHKVIHLPFDAGFGAMSNAIIDALVTDFYLVGSDDFDFTPTYVRPGIERLLDVLESTDVDVASGRVRGPYEFDLEIRGDEVIEHKVNIPAHPVPYYVTCDVTVNYSLFKKRVFEKIRWDDEIKICGGEHGAQFYDIKKSGYKVAWVPNVFIGEQSGVDSPRYMQYRSRGGKSRPAFDKRGIRKWVLGTGQVDYNRVDYPEPITR